MNELTVQDELRGYELPEQQEKEIKVVSQSEFDQLSLPTIHFTASSGSKTSKQTWNQSKALATQNKTNNPSLQKSRVQ